MLQKRKGQALIVITITLMALIGMLALVIDTGRAYIDHSRLQKSVDAAVLAGVQELPSNNDAEALRIAREAFDANMNSGVAGHKDVNYQITPIAGNPKSPDQIDRLFLTADMTVTNQLANFLGYPDWPIVAQAGARSGPIGRIQHWIPIGVEEGPIELYEHYRLGNTEHALGENSNGHRRNFVPLQNGNIKDEVANTIKSSISAGQVKNIAKNVDILDVCEGVGNRMRQKIGVEGCFNVDEATPNTDGLNIVGPGVRKDWAYGDDPRLVYVPFVKQSTKDTVEIVGFGLFYIEYAHYDSQALGTQEPLTEIVGYFVRTIMEGPILDNAENYGVTGIEYLDFL